MLTLKTVAFLLPVLFLIKRELLAETLKKIIFTYLLTTRWLRNSISGLKSAVFLDPENFDDSAGNKIFVAYAHAQNGRKFLLPVLFFIKRELLAETLKNWYLLTYLLRADLEILFPV